MTAPITGVRIVVDTTGGVRSFEQLQQAALATPATFQKATLSAASYSATVEQLIKQSQRWTDITAQAAAQAGAIATRFQRDFARTQADIKESLARGLITPEQAQQQGAAAGQAFNRGLLSQIDKIGARGGFQGAGGQALFVGLADQLQTVDRTAAAAAPNFGRLSNAMSGAALAAAGIPGPVGKIAQALGALTIGGGVAGLAIAGIAAIAVVFKSMADRAEEAARPLKELAERAKALGEAANERAGLTLAKDLATATQGALELEPVIDRLTKQLAELNKLGSLGQSTARRFGLADQLADANDRLTSFRSATAAFQQETDRRDEEKRKRDEAAAEAERKRQQAIADERAQQVQTLEDLERENAVDSAKRANDTLGLIIALEAQRTAAIEKQVAAAKLLTEAQREQLRVALQIKTAQDRGDFPSVDGLRDLRARPLPVPQVSDPEARAAAQSKLAAELARNLDALIATMAFEVRVAKDLAQAEAKLLAERLRIIQALGDLAASFVGFGVAAGALGPEVAAVLDGIVQLSVGLASKNPAAIASGAAQVVGALLGMGDAAREAAAEIAESKRQFQLALEDFANPARTSFEQITRSIQEQFDLLAREAARLSGFETRGRDVGDIEAAARSRSGRPRGREEAAEFLAELDRLKAILAERLAQARVVAEAEIARLGEDLEVRALVAQGRSAEADAMRAQLEAERELTDLRDRYGDLLTPVIEAQLQQVQALEAEARARQQLEAAQRRSEDLGVRELVARQALGQATAAEIDARRREVANRRELQEAEAAGLSAAEIARIRYIQGLEAEAAAAIAAAQALADADAALQRSTDFLGDLEVRRLVATGDPGAEALRISLEQQREIQRALAEGIDAAGIAQLRYVHGLEDEARARQAAEDAQRKQIELMEREARLRDDLAVRDLRSRGLGGAADDVAFLQRQQQELRDAQAGGLSAASLAELLRVQQQERAQFDAQRRAQQQADFDRAASANFGLTSPQFGPESTPSVNLAVGTSEGTSNALRGIATSQLVVQTRFLPFLESIDQKMGRLLAVRGVSADDIDQAFGALADDDDRTVGRHPSNV